MKYQKFLSIFLFILVLTSCGIFKPKEQDPIIIETNVEIDSSYSDIFDTINIKNSDYKTLYIKYAAHYTTSEQNLNFYGTIRIVKDSIMLLTLSPGFGIEIGRVLISKDSVKFYNNMQNSYFKEDITYFQTNYGLAIDFNSIQAIVTNNTFAYPNFRHFSEYEHKSDSSFNLLQNTVFNSQDDSKIDILHQFFVKNNNLIDSLHITDNISKKKFDVKYNSFQKVGNNIFPDKLNCLLVDKGVTALNFNFNKIYIDKPLNIRFNIPSNAKEIIISNN